MSHFQYIMEVFVEMRRQLPQHEPILRLRGNDLVFQMRHLMDDWPEWVLDLNEPEQTPAEFAAALVKLVNEVKA